MDIEEQYQELLSEYKRVEHSMFHYKEYTEQVKTPLPVTELHRIREELFEEIRELHRKQPKKKEELDKWL